VVELLSNDPSLSDSHDVLLCCKLEVGDASCKHSHHETDLTWTEVALKVTAMKEFVACSTVAWLIKRMQLKTVETYGQRRKEGSTGHHLHSNCPPFFPSRGELISLAQRNYNDVHITQHYYYTDLAWFMESIH